MNIIFSRLANPFPPEDIEWRAGSTNKEKTRALALAYITSRAVMDRLDEVVGPENWRDEYRPGPNGGVVCGLSLRIENEWITKWDGADNTEFEGVKGGLSDAFKRSGYKWGIGRYLYKLDGQWVECETFGKTVRLKNIPGLPPWALPDGYKSKQSQSTLKPATELSEPKANGKTHKTHEPQAVFDTFTPQAVVEVGLFETVADFSRIWNRSPFITGKHSDADKWGFCRLYRGWRDSGKSTDEAIELAANKASPDPDWTEAGT